MVRGKNFCIIKDFDVHFQLNGYFKVEAKTEEEAREKVEKFIAKNIKKIEDILGTGLADDSYTTDVFVC